MIWRMNPTLFPWWGEALPVPWHAVFGVAYLAALIWLFFRWRKQGSLTFNDFTWLAFIAVGHLFYVAKLSDDNPTFNLEIRYYGVFFAIGLLGAARAMPVYFRDWGFPKRYAETLTLWLPVAMLFGAHFIHLLFYEPESFVQRPIRILQIGSGLASHGGGLGAILATWYFARREKVSVLRLMDAAMCMACWVIPWVRVGNFFNSEILGRPWSGPWAVAFPRADCQIAPGRPVDETWGQLGVGDICPNGHEIILRHPSQVYEALLGFTLLGLAIYLYRRWRFRLRPGAIFFSLLGFYFTTRFLVEYVKQSGQSTMVNRLDAWVVETGFLGLESWPLTMGQMLSLPIVLLALYMLFVNRSTNLRSTVKGKAATAWELEEEEETSTNSKSAKVAKSSKRSGSKGTASKASGSSGGSASAKRRKKKRPK